MRAWLRHLLEPAQTSPTDAFTWNDNRPKGKQVANGFRIAGGFIAGFFVIVAAGVGVTGLSGGHSTQSGVSVLVSWAALVLAAVIMFWTANRWAGFVTGFFFGPALLKIFGALLVGDDSYYLSHSITRTDLAELLAYVLAVL